MAKPPTIRLALTAEDLAKLRRIQLHHKYPTVNHALRHAIDFSFLCYDQSPYPSDQEPRSNDPYFND